MAKEPTEPDDDKLSDNPEENLRMANELLKLKLQAQFGAIMGEGKGEIPPDIENQFLKNVFAFEQSQGEFKPIKVAEFLGFPHFQKAGDLTDAQLKKEYHRLEQLLNKKRLAVDFIRPREVRFKYQFITEELFGHTMESMMPGMSLNFIYEEFHPDHDLEIRRRADDFMSDWFGKEFNEYSSELGYQFFLPNSQILSRAETLAKIQNLFDCYTSFKNCRFALREVKFELYEDTQTGMGHAEGGVTYDAITETGEMVHFKGPFKLYLSHDDGWWSVVYFVFPGFEW